jgi:glucosamine-6-phosphate deaminase
MKILVAENYEEMSRLAADIVAAQVKEKPACVLGLATGGTPVGMYKCLVDMHKAGALDFSSVTSFNLDEYYPIKRANDQSYYYFMFDNLFSHVNIKKENVNVPNGEVSDPDAECKAYDEKIEAHGGIDLQVLGIGHNGHIGFNEPGSAHDSPTRVVTLEQETREANARFFDDDIERVPRQAMTQGIGTILKARSIVLLAFGAGKAEAVARALEGPIDEASPASALRKHADVTILLDKAAASMLS